MCLLRERREGSPRAPLETFPVAAEAKREEYIREGIVRRVNIDEKTAEKQRKRIEREETKGTEEEKSLSLLCLPQL